VTRAALTFALVAAFTQPLYASARGEASYTLPELRGRTPVGAHIVRTELWTRPGSAPLAIAPSIVVFVSHGRVCGFQAATGKQLWCAGAGASPAFAGGRIAYSASAGGVNVVDAGTGTHLWRVSGAVAAWAAGDDFLISCDAPHPTVSEYDRSGRRLWSARGPDVRNGTMLVTPPYAFLSAVYSGATMVKVQSVLRLGSGGGLESEITNAWDILDVSPPRIVYAADRIEEIQDHFITFDVVTADLPSGKIEAQYHYEPDYDTNNALLASNAYAGRSSGPIRVDSDAVYVMFFGEKIYRYRLADAAGQRPLLVSGEGTFVGGPYRGWLYVSRPDGVWALKPDSNEIHARLVAPVNALHMSVVGDVVYLTTADQEVVGVDSLDGRTVFDARPCGRSGTESGIGGSGKIVYVVCVGAAQTTVTAFPKPLG
jgi:outer membrane protein assembly factor BamB